MGIRAGHRGDGAGAGRHRRRGTGEVRNARNADATRTDACDVTGRAGTQGLRRERHRGSREGRRRGARRRRGEFIFISV